MAEKKELNPSPKFPSGDYPKLSPNPNQVDGLVNKTGEKPNTQFVNLPKEQEKRCLTVSEVIELIIKYAPKGDTLPEVTAEDNEKVLEVIAGAWGKGGKKVNVIDAPASTTLTDKEFEQFKEGCFINGDYLGFHNPIVVPANKYAYDGVYYGIIIGRSSRSDLTSDTYIALYAVNYQKKVSIVYQALAFGLEGIKILYKLIPVTQNNITSGDVIALDSNLGKALLDHLEVEINGFRARYEYTSGNYIVYSSKTEVDSGLKLQINMISYNTTNGELSFNQMTFTPDA